MLVLKRGVRESIVIGVGHEALIKIVVIQNDGDHVRIGVEAPREWFVLREEVYNPVGGLDETDYFDKD